MEARLDFPLYVSGRLAACMLERYRQAAETRPEKITFDLRACAFIDPFGLVFVTALIRQSVRGGTRVAYVAPREKRVREHLASIGFDKSFKLRSPTQVNLEGRAPNLRLRTVVGHDAAAA